jgi:hypothetical protein
VQNVHSRRAGTVVVAEGRAGDSYPDDVRAR